MTDDYLTTKRGQEALAHHLDRWAHPERYEERFCNDPFRHGCSQPALVYLEYAAEYRCPECATRYNPRTAPMRATAETQW